MVYINISINKASNKKYNLLKSNIVISYFHLTIWSFKMLNIETLPIRTDTINSLDYFNSDIKLILKWNCNKALNSPHRRSLEDVRILTYAGLIYCASD